MSKATKRKYVVHEIQQDLSIPTETQSIVRILGSRGNNLHEVVDCSGEQFLVSMPTKFRRNIWVKAGDHVLVEPIPEGDKVKAEIIKILTREHIKYYRVNNCWPQEFEQDYKVHGKLPVNERDEKSTESDDDELFVNTNRLPETHTLGSDSDTTSDDSR